MIDTCLKSSDNKILSELCKQYPDVIGPVRGRAAMAGYEGKDFWIEAVPARGDPSKFYACVRHSEPITFSEPIEACEQVECEAVLGKWA